MSKGSRQRPRQITQELYENNWDRIFGKKSQKDRKTSETSTEITKNKSK